MFHGVSVGLSYTVPILKNNNSICCKSATVDDFRGISVSPVISKVFEHCILDRFGDFLVSCDNQFGFKKHHIEQWFFTGCTCVKYGS